MRIGFEIRTLFSSIKSDIQKVRSIPLVRETLRVSLPLYLTGPNTTKFLRNYSKFQFSLLRRLSILIIIYLDMLLMGRTIVKTLMAKNTAIFLHQQVEFVLNFKKLVLTPTQKIGLLGVTVNSLTATLSLSEKKVSKIQ